MIGKECSEIREITTANQSASPSRRTSSREALYEYEYNTRTRTVHSSTKVWTFVFQRYISSAVAGYEYSQTVRQYRLKSSRPEKGADLH